LVIGDVEDLVWNYVGLGFAVVPKAEFEATKDSPAY
jgi:hypothetical protein